MTKITFSKKLTKFVKFLIKFFEDFPLFSRLFEKMVSKKLSKILSKKLKLVLKRKAFCKGLFCSKSDQKSAQKVMKNHQFLMIFWRFSKVFRTWLVQGRFRKFSSSKLSENDLKWVHFDHFLRFWRNLQKLLKVNFWYR